jgi:hypothetical protein
MNIATGIENTGQYAWEYIARFPCRRRGSLYGR